MALGIARSTEWEYLISRLKQQLTIYKDYVIATGRSCAVNETFKAVGKHDGFLEAITFIEHLGKEKHGEKDSSEESIE